MQLNRNVLLLAILGTCCASFGVAACSADGAGGEADPAADAGVADNATPDATTPMGARDAAADRSAPRDAVADAVRDAQTRDTAAPFDAGVDAASDAGSDAVADAADASTTRPPVVDAGYDPPGSPCPAANATESRTCGRCGTERRLCWAEDGGGSVWLDWGPCQGEKADAGLPNTQVSLECEMCGTKTITFDSQCNASVGFCQPAAGAQCEKGAGEWAPGLSCGAGEGRYRACDDLCKWASFSECTTFQNPNKLTIAALADAGANVVTATFQLSANPKIKRLVGATDQTCPLGATFPQSDLTAYAYVDVRNPTSRTAVVSLWHQTGDTQMAVYAGSAPPEDDASRRNCIAGTKATDSCPTTLAAQCNGTSQFSVAGVAAVTIPPNSSITVYNTVYSSSTSAGPIQLSVRTDSLQ